MRILRDVYSRTAFARYFEGLEPIDRATFWVVVALALALGIALQVIFRPVANEDLSTQPLPSAPSERRFA